MSVTYPVVPALPYAVHPFTQNMIQQQAILEQLMRSSGLNNGITSVSTRNKAETKRKLEDSCGNSPLKATKTSQNLGPSSSGRKDNSLGSLTQKFMQLIESSPDGTLDLNDAYKVLSVQKRRIYDITNVLEGVGLVEKKSKNNIVWKCVFKVPTSHGARGGSVVIPEASTADLTMELARLRQDECVIDKNIEALQLQIKAMLEEELMYAYVDKDDILDLESMQDQIVLSVKAQPGTRLEVPDPATVDLETSILTLQAPPGKSKYRIYLQGEETIYVCHLEEEVVEQSSNTDQSSQDGIEQQQPQQPEPEPEPEALRTLPDFDSNPNLLKLDYEFDYIFNIGSGEGISDFL